MSLTIPWYFSLVLCSFLLLLLSCARTIVGGEITYAVIPPFDKKNNNSDKFQKILNEEKNGYE